jgi:hypothetical protein
MSHKYTCQASLIVIVLATAACGGYGPPDVPTPQHLAESVVKTAFIVGARDFTPFKVVLTPDMTNARLEGTFSASGANGDVEITLLDEAQFDLWKNRQKFAAAYQSGRVTSGQLQVNLPSRPGTYFLVFSNRFSLLSNKAVTADLELRYDRQS